MLFGSLKGTGTLVLGRQGGGTGEWVPGTSASGQRILHVFPCGTSGRVLFGSLEGTGTLVLGRQGSRTSEQVPGTGA